MVKGNGEARSHEEILAEWMGWEVPALMTVVNAGFLVALFAGFTPGNAGTKYYIALTAMMTGALFISTIVRYKEIRGAHG